MKQSNKESKPLKVVNSYNEWDLLEEVIVGVIDGAMVPPWHVTLEATMPEKQWDFYRQNGGKPFPKERIEAAKRELDEFVHILEAEGVTVRRPEVREYSKPYSTPNWESQCGLYAAMPRDVIFVAGDEIIEAPMSWRSRHLEINGYRPLLKEYFHKGARWTSVPRPELSDELYNYNYKEPNGNGHINFVINEFEPTFDAADFIKCGKDIFYQKSHVTNNFGIDWLIRHLGDTFRFHEVKANDKSPMHIDATFMPLAPGKILVNPERILSLPDMFESWDVIYAPQPCMSEDHMLYMTSRWINMNLLMLDHQRVIVEKHEHAMINELKKFGLKPIPCQFQDFNSFGGSFHCATIDIRRRGELQSYF